MGILLWWECEGTDLSAAGNYTVGDTSATADGGAITTDACKMGTYGVDTSGGGGAYTLSITNNDTFNASAGGCACWFNVQSWVNDGTILVFRDTSSGDRLEIKLDSDDELEAHWTVGGYNTYTQTVGGANPADLSTGSWYFLIFTYNNSANTRTISVYNSSGTLVGTGTNTNSSVASLTIDVGTMYVGDYMQTADLYVDHVIVGTSTDEAYYLARRDLSYSTPLTVTKVVDPDQGTGHDYHSLSDWEADLGNTTSGDLPADNEIAVAKCRCTGGTADTTAVTIDGWTTSSTQYIKIWTDPAEGYRHSGKWETGNKYRITSDAYFATISNGNSARLDLHIDGLQIETTREDGEGANGCGVFSYQSYIFNLIISNCVIRNSASTPSSSGVGVCIFDAASSGSTSFVAYNNVVYGFDEAVDGSGIRYSCVATGATRTIVIYNNTLCYNYINLNLNPAWTPDTIYFYVKNNIMSDHTGGSDFSRTDTAGSWATSKNISSDTSSPDSSYREKTVLFVSEAGRDFHLQPEDTEAKGNGDNLYNDATYPFQTDIDGDDRGGSGAEWDIGADEYVSSLVLNQYSFRFRNDDGSETTATWKKSQDVNIYLK